jgi:hypothetical protein
MTSTNGRPGITASEKLLVAAAMFGESFSRDELLVAAHAYDPALFGLHTIPGIPSEVRTMSVLDGKKGIVRRGYLESLGKGTKRYRLTPFGRQRLAAIANGDTGRYMFRPSITRDDELIIDALLAASACTRCRSGMPVDAPQVRDWLTICPDVPALVERVRPAVGGGLALSTGRELTGADLDGLMMTHELARERTARALTARRNGRAAA